MHIQVCSLFEEKHVICNCCRSIHTYLLFNMQYERDCKQDCWFSRVSNNEFEINNNHYIIQNHMRNDNISSYSISVWFNDYTLYTYVDTAQIASCSVTQKKDNFFEDLIFQPNIRTYALMSSCTCDSANVYTVLFCHETCVSDDLRRE